MKHIIFLAAVVMLASCATYTKTTIPIDPSTDNEKIFDCTIDSVKKSNHSIGVTLGSKGIPKRIFQEKIMYKNIKTGRIILGKRDNSLGNYPVDVTRVNNNIVIRSSGYGLYYSNDFNLEPNISRLSKLIEECIVKE